MTWADGVFLAGAIVLVCGCLVAISVAIGDDTERRNYRR